MTEVYLISSQIYYDNANNSHKRIITIDHTPKGPLSALTRRINIPRLSSYHTNAKCVLAIHSDITNEVLDITNQGALLTYLLQNNYTVDTDMTNLINKQPAQDSSVLLYVIKYIPGE